ncbi:MAG: hypothetical protein H7Y89_12305 [Steroidobacteraceae bacterium]|nr:hypothetical protein [Steroidobacteraceae bacterium]
MKLDIRKIFWSLTAASLAATASAADKRIPLPAGEAMIISWNPIWVVAELDDRDPAGTVRFNGGNRELWEVTIAPLPPHPSLTGDTGNLRIYVRNMARGLENAGVTVDPEQRALEGGIAKGFYVKAHDIKASSRERPNAKKKPKAPNYSHGYVGAISVGGRPYLFEVLWNSGAEKTAEAALAAMRSVRVQ